MTSPIRFSHLRAYGRSAMHGHYAMTAAEEDPTYAQERGTAVHALLFGTKKVIGYPGSVRRGKEYDAFAAKHADYEILTMNEYDKARRMADAVRACKVAEPFLGGEFLQVEQTVLFRWNGLDCRSTPDVRGPTWVAELKTAPSSDPARFTWHAIKMGYHAQLAMERLATQASRAFIICVEATEPHPVTVFEVDAPTLELGDKLLTLWAERLKASESAQAWPPYAQSIVTLSAPQDVELEYGDG